MSSGETPIVVSDLKENERVLIELNARDQSGGASYRFAIDGADKRLAAVLKGEWRANRASREVSESGMLLGIWAMTDTDTVGLGRFLERVRRGDVYNLHACHEVRMDLYRGGNLVGSERFPLHVRFDWQLIDDGRDESEEERNRSGRNFGEGPLVTFQSLLDRMEALAARERGDCREGQSTVRASRAAPL